MEWEWLLIGKELMSQWRKFSLYQIHETKKEKMNFIEDRIKSCHGKCQLRFPKMLRDGKILKSVTFVVLFFSSIVVQIV